MEKLQFTRAKKLDINKTKETKKRELNNREYLFAMEAEQKRRAKQHLRKMVFENIKNILGSEEAIMRFDDIVRDIHNVCFGDLLQEQKQLTIDDDTQVTSINDVVTGKALEQFKNSVELGKNIIFNDKSKKKNEKLIPVGREEISSHVMYRVLVATQIDDKLKERDRTFVYDDRDKKIENILNGFAKVQSEEELFTLENKLKKR